MSNPKVFTGPSTGSGGIGIGGTTLSTSFSNAQGETIRPSTNSSSTSSSSSSSASSSIPNPAPAPIAIPTSSAPIAIAPQQQQQLHPSPLNPHSQRDWAVQEVLEASKVSKQKEWVKLMKLSRLASQHHLSPYSKMKYGELGSPYAYIPLTLQQPDLVETTMAKQRQNEQAASQWMLKKRERMLYGDGAESSDLNGLENPRSDQDPTNEVTLPDQSDLEMRSASPIKPDSSTSTPIPDSNSLPSRNGNGSSSSISDPHLHPHGSPCGIKRPASTAPITSASEIRATSLQKIEDDMDFNSSEGSNALGLKSLDNNLGDGSVEKEIADAMNEESFKKNGDSMDWSANNSPKNLKTVLNENGSAPTSSNSTPQPVPAPSPTTVQTLSTGKGFLPSSLSSSVHFLSVLQAKAKIQYMRELQEKEETAVKEDVARKEREKGLEHEREAERERERRREKDEKERIEKEKETATDNGNGTATADQQNQPASGTASASTTNQTQAQASAIKTSDTHPINISTIVPMELIPLISSRIYDSQSGVLPKKVLSELEEADKEGRSRQEKRRSLTNGTNSQPSDGAPNVNGSGSKPEEMEEIGVQPSIPVPSFDSSNLHSQRQVSGERLIRVGNTIDLAFYSAHNSLADGDGAQKPNGSSSNPSTSTIQSIKKVGNLFLSSCPGKKVRLTGPVRGRGAICRDLGIDLSRIHLLGVGAVVCCLDDEELALLGAPWSEYEREADSLGLHVVRLPMAEGYAPSDVATIDAMVTAVAQDYSLRGRNVLIHCRGGVGRAGLVACAWLMKMGLVRQVQLQQGSNGKDQKMLDGGGDIDEEPASDEIIKTVENLIETIRRRRSPKAIETAEQVKFVVDYVAYLQTQEKLYQSNLSSQ